MARGVQPGAVQLMEESSITAQTLCHWDSWEFAALETLRAALAEERPDIDGCRRIVAQLLRHDITENRAHRELADLTRGAVSA